MTDTTLPALPMKRSQLLVDVENAYGSIKKFFSKLMDKSYKYCPDVLKGFDTKYPELGKLKNDMLSVVKFAIVRITLVVVVIPAIVIGLGIFVVNKFVSLFRKKD